VTTLLHSSLSAVSHTTSLPVMDNHTSPRYHPSSTILVVCLYVGPHPCTMRSMIVFINLLSGIRHIWPNNCSFLCFIMSTIDTYSHYYMQIIQNCYSSNSVRDISHVNNTFIVHFFTIIMTMKIECSNCKSVTKHSISHVYTAN